MMAEQCKYMSSAYPDLTGDDTCADHDHTPTVFTIATVLAQVFQGADPSDEKIAWFLNDAQAIHDALGDAEAWEIENKGYTEGMRGVDYLLSVNGVEFVIPESEWEPSVPVLRSEWETDHGSSR